MKLGFYPRLAWSGMKNNRRLFVPYILAAAGTAAVFYIMFYLASGDLLDGMRGGTAAQSTLSFGVFVIVAFALLFLFYCNSFLVRRRYKEFGLYSILGMNKHNISRILAWETLLTALLSLIGGIFIGALLSKLAEMIFLHMLGGTADYSLHISLPAIKYMLLYFGGIFALIYISSLIKLHRSTAVELVHSESYGEKPVKANPVLGIAGIVLLSAAYILAVSIKEPPAGAHNFLHRRHHGHRRHLSRFHIGQRPAVQNSSEKQALLLHAPALRLRFLDDLPHEAQRRGACVDLHPRNDGAGHDILHLLPVLRHGRLRQRTLSA